MSKILKKIGLKIVEGFKGFDRFPKIVTFTYKGEDEFKTVIGGIVSIGTLVVLFLYSYLMLRITYEKKDTAISISESFIDLTKDNDPIWINGTSFMFALFVKYGSINLLSDETYIKMKVWQRVRYGYDNTVNTQIPVSRCTFDQFPTINRTLLEIANITNYYCPSTNELKAQGNLYSSTEDSYFYASIEKCSGTDSKGNMCKTDSEIATALSKSYIQMAFVNTYFDVEDYSHPIKDFLDDSIYDYLVSGYTKQISTFVKQNTISLKDTIYRYSPDGTEDSFISIDTVRTAFKTQVDNNLAYIWFYKDPKSTQYDRQVFSLLDCFGNIGGVNEILEISGGLIVALFSGKIFLFSILSSMYQVDSNYKDKDHKHHYKNEESQRNLNENYSEEIKFDGNAAGRNNYNRDKPDKNDNNQIIDNCYAETDLNPRFVKMAADMMKTRFRYNYSALDFCYNLLIPFKCFGRYCRK